MDIYRMGMRVVACILRALMDVNEDIVSSTQRHIFKGYLLPVGQKTDKFALLLELLPRYAIYAFLIHKEKCCRTPILLLLYYYTLTPFLHLDNRTSDHE